MNLKSASKRVVVVGDGILGASVGRAARRGADVTVVGSGPDGGGATWRSFGWLNAAQEVPEAYHRLRTLSLSRYRELAASAPYDAAVRFCGALSWERDGATVQLIQGAEETEPVAATYRRLRAGGHSVETITRAEALALEPALSASALPADGIMLARDEGWLDVPALAGLFLADLVGAGGRILHDAAGARVEVSSGRARVLLSDGTPVPADEVVLAAGAHTSALLVGAGLHVPQRSTPAALLFLEPTSLQLRRLVRTPAGSLRPRPGGGAVVHTSTIESALRPDGQGGFVVDEQSVCTSLAELGELFASGAPLRVDRVATGLRPIPGDGWSVAGRPAGVTGCSVLFSHSGVTLGPILGELLAAELLDEDFRSPLLAPFRPERFAAGGAA